MRINSLYLAGIATMMGVSSAVQAQQVITPTAVTNVFGADADAGINAISSVGIDRLIDGSGFGTINAIDNTVFDPMAGPLTLANIDTVLHQGFNFAVFDNNGTEATTWLSDGTGDSTSFFEEKAFSPGPDPYVVTMDFDLGGTFNLDTFYAWQYNDSFFGGGGNGVQDFTLEFSTDGGATFGAPQAFALTSANTVMPIDPFANHSFVDNGTLEYIPQFLQTAQTVALGGVSADTVRFSVSSNFFDSENWGGERIGLGEVRFVGSPDSLPGDLDGDGFVGIDDLNLVLGNWNQNIPPANPLADPSGDGFVGIDDLNAVLGNWNAGTPPTAGAAVPEPGTLMVLGIGAVAVSFRRR